MGKASEPQIKDFHGKDHTCITFKPDLAKFKMDKLDKDTVSLLTRRAFDIAGSVRGLEVYLNKEKIKVRGLPGSPSPSPSLSLLPSPSLPPSLPPSLCFTMCLNLASLTKLYYCYVYCIGFTVVIGLVIHLYYYLALLLEGPIEQFSSFQYLIKFLFSHAH